MAETTAAPTQAQFKWLFGRDTGMSSEVIWRHMVGVGEVGEPMRMGAYPHDPDDLGRCVRLLDRFPEWRERMGEMAEVNPEWAALVEHWAELEALYHEELAEGTGMAPRCYARMKEVLSHA